MGNRIVTIYDTLKVAETAIETVDETKQIHLFGFLEGAYQKIGVVKRG